MVPVKEGKFDAGARFTNTSPPSIPPPPPGCAPNSQQLAAAGLNPGAAGKPVDKKKSGFWKGTGGGGVTFW